jgi:hypothetical protein
MRDNRLQLVEPEYSAKASTDAPTELVAMTAMPDDVGRGLRLVETDDGAPPDDAA